MNDKNAELTAEAIEADMEENADVKTMGIIGAGDTALPEEAQETESEDLIGGDAEEAFRRQETEGSIKVNPDSQKGDTLSSIYASRQNKSANATQKREIYGSQWDDVRLIGDVEDFTIDAQKRKEEYLKLSHSQKAGQVLTGVIIGAAPESYAPMAMVSLTSTEGESSGFFQIKIPAQRLFDFDEKVLTTDVGKNAILNELNHRIGGKISFIVKSVDETAAVAYACRINAMDIAGKQNFIDLQREDDNPRLFAGIKTNATVLAIHRDNLVCDVGGVECQIPREELSWIPLRELNKEFKVGQKFLVKILNVEKYSTKKGNDTFRNMIRLDVSKKQAESNPNKKYFGTIAENATYGGEVKYCTQGVIHVVIAGKIACVCPIPSFAAGSSGQLPVRGQKCLVRITKKEIIERENGNNDYRISARIIRYDAAT